MKWKITNREGTGNAELVTIILFPASLCRIIITIVYLKLQDQQLFPVDFILLQNGFCIWTNNLCQVSQWKCWKSDIRASVFNNVTYITVVV